MKTFVTDPGTVLLSFTGRVGLRVLPALKGLAATVEGERAQPMDEQILHIQHCMYQYSRAIYRSIKDLIDPYVGADEQLEYRREVLAACEGTMERLAQDPHYFAKPDKALFQDIRRYFPITVQAQVAWAVIARHRRGGRLRRGSDRSRCIRRRCCTLPRNDTQRQGVPADPASEPRLLPEATSISSAAKLLRDDGSARRRASDIPSWFRLPGQPG